MPPTPATSSAFLPPASRPASLASPSTVLVRVRRWRRGRTSTCSACCNNLAVILRQDRPAREGCSPFLAAWLETSENDAHFQKGSTAMEAVCASVQYQ